MVPETTDQKLIQISHDLHRNRLHSPVKAQLWDDLSLSQVIKEDSPSDENKTMEEAKAEDFRQKILVRKTDDQIKSSLTEGMFVQNYLSRLSTQSMR